MCADAVPRHVRTALAIKPMAKKPTNAISKTVIQFSMDHSK